MIEKGELELKKTKATYVDLKKTKLIDVTRKISLPNKVLN
jgi:hypothetical protein